jgi:hypothetical protein
MQQTNRMLLADILSYGTITADFECLDHQRVYVRVRTADLNGRKYFIVQRGGEIVEIREI